MQSLPPRPLPSGWRRRARPPGEHRQLDALSRLAAPVATRVRWIGAGRVAAASATVVAVIAGGYWLVRPPDLPTEASLPFATPSAEARATTATAEDDGGAVAPPAHADNGDDVITVHVAGAVREPGVYVLASGARAIDAVRAAGGLAADAEGDRINLAAVLADGQRVFVPRVGEDDPLGDAAQPAGGDTPAGPVNLNSASVAQLETLPGVGPTTAAAIVAHRDLHGPFASVDELAEVTGIGPAKLAALRGLVTV